MKAAIAAKLLPLFAKKTAWSFTHLGYNVNGAQHTQLQLIVVDQIVNAVVVIVSAIAAATAATAIQLTDINPLQSNYAALLGQIAECQLHRLEIFPLQGAVCVNAPIMDNQHWGELCEVSWYCKRKQTGSLAVAVWDTDSDGCEIQVVACKLGANGGAVISRSR